MKYNNPAVTHLTMLSRPNALINDPNCLVIDRQTLLLFKPVLKKVCDAPIIEVHSLTCLREPLLVKSNTLKLALSGIPISVKGGLTYFFTNALNTTLIKHMFNRNIKDLLVFDRRMFITNEELITSSDPEIRRIGAHILLKSGLEKLFNKTIIRDDWYVGRDPFEKRKILEQRYHFLKHIRKMH